MYFNRELILGLLLESDKLEFNNEQILETFILLKQIINDETMYIKDLNKELDSFWCNYYYIENGFYKLKDINNKEILHIAAFNLLKDILKVNKYSDLKINDIVLNIKEELPKMFKQKTLIK